VVEEGELDRAAQATHTAFGLAPPRPLPNCSAA
jgi:hypothetical protein